MKKLFALVLALAMVATMGLAAFAEKGGFVYSPSVNPAPTIEDQEHSGDCPGEITVTPYVDRDELDEEAREAIEDAYESILNVEDGDDLYEILEDLAEELGVPVDNIKVSDLFDLGFEGCEDHSSHMPYTVQLSSDTFENFAGLVHYENGKWVVVENVTIDESGVMSFTYDGYGLFAVIVNTTSSPVTGDNGILIFSVVMMALSAVGFVAVYIAAKKKKAVQSR